MANYDQMLAGWLQQLQQRPNIQVGLTDQERSAIYGLGRQQIQGATRTSAEQLRTAMGGQGFRAGESGIADTALANIYRGGAEQLAQYSGNLAAQEAQNRFSQRLGIEQLMSNRLGTGAGILGSLRGAQMQAGATTAAARMAANTAADRLSWEKERFKEYTFPWEQEQGTWGNLMQMYGMQQQGQQYAYQPWYTAMINAYGS